MTFLNATLIFGVAAAAIPIVLHLIARREPRKVVFPSVRFLTKRFESNRSRLRLRRWWLLALRIAAVAALAFALARPAIHRSLSITWLTIGLLAIAGVALLVMATVAFTRGPSRSTSYVLGSLAAAALLVSLLWGVRTYAWGPAPALDQVEPAAIAIVLDNSSTSAWKTADDDRIGRLMDLATWLVTRVPRTSRIAVVDRSSQVASFSLDVGSAISKIEQIRPLEVTQPIASRIDAAVRLVRSSDLPNRQVVVITDLSKQSWDASSESGLSALLVEDPQVMLTVFDLGDFEGLNRSISDLRIADPTPPRGVPVTISAPLELTAPEGTTARSITAELEMYEQDPALPVVRDGVVVTPATKSVDRTSLRVAPGGSSELLLTIPSLELGTHHGRIRLVGEDAMPLDDTRYFTVEVLAPSPVLLVSDNEDVARIMRQAIIAAPGIVDETNAEFLVERVQFRDLSVLRLDDFDTLILLDPPRDALRDEALLEFAQAGGGVLVSLGASAGDVGFDSPLVPTLVRRWRVPPPGDFFQVLSTTHPVTQSLAEETPWSDFRVYQYWQLQPGPSDSTLIRLAASENAALIERTLSNGGTTSGRVLILTTPVPALSPPNQSWNDLFGIDPWPAWLLTRNSVEYLSGRGETQMTTTVGTPQTIPLAEARRDGGQTTRRIQMFAPRQSTPIPLEVPDGATEVTATETSRSGTYWIRGTASGAGFSANLPAAAINLERIDRDQLDQVFGPERYRLVTDREGLELAENQATQRVPLDSPAVLLALVVFLLEQILGNRFYRSPARPAVAA